MVFLKTEDEIELMRAANLLVADTLAELGKIIRPGVSTAELDKVAEEYIRDHGAVPTFKGFPNPFGGPFPGSVCTSVNDVVVHGIPGEEVLKDGDIISVDSCILLNGFHSDSAYTFPVGDVKPEEVSAKYEDGILKLTMPKQVKREQPKSSSIAIG